MKMLQLPMGCYFTPKPYECIKYLSLKVHGSLDICFSWDGLIFDCDPYNPKQLPDLFSTVERRDNLYFFTKLRRKRKTGSIHIDRTVVGVDGENKGTWRADQTKEVRDADNISVIGSARTFTFRGKKGDPKYRRFLMTEYQLLPSNGNDDGHDSAALYYDPLKDYVLCHLRCAAEGKGGKATKSINNLKRSDCSPPLPPQPPCPAANCDITAEAFPSCSPDYSLQTPTYSPIDNVLADTDPIAVEQDDDSYAQIKLFMGTTGDDEDVLPLSAAAPLPIHTDNQLALNSVAAGDNSSSYCHNVEPPSVLPLVNTAVIPSPALLHNPITAVEHDYNILFDTLQPINI